MGRKTCDAVQRVSRKAKYERQKLRTEANRRNRHKNHIRIHPNDLPALKLLKLE